MNELVAFLAGFYLLFNWQWIWKKFTTATNEGRIAFGLALFNGAMLYLWYVVMR